MRLLKKHAMIIFELDPTLYVRQKLEDSKHKEIQNETFR